MIAEIVSGIHIIFYGSQANIERIDIKYSQSVKSKYQNHRNKED